MQIRGCPSHAVRGEDRARRPAGCRDTAGMMCKRALAPLHPTPPRRARAACTMRARVGCVQKERVAARRCTFIGRICALAATGSARKASLGPLDSAPPRRVRFRGACRRSVRWGGTGVERAHGGYRWQGAGHSGASARIHFVVRGNQAAPWPRGLYSLSRYPNLRSASHRPRATRCAR